ncbi:hypothetical protein VNO78_06848 [Psophocarpus tetragonolobus]|uniref:Flavin-containing monooxygenase n=1 Tax=Psophocarpus tetragonolobus TaxID=3891 RepID=A0AAN9SU26_PSOTE
MYERLQRENHNVVVFEQNHVVGGNWVYDPRTESDPLSLDPNRETVHSSVYVSLRTNLPRAIMSFRDFPFLRSEHDPRTFPGHEEVFRFLNRFTDEFGIQQLIRFGRRVVRVERENEGWSVESLVRSSGSVNREVFEAVVVCSGHYSTPRIAEIEGIEKWKGFQMHSHNYRVPEPFRNQIVLLVGYGPSAYDITQDILPVAKEVHIAVKYNRYRVKFKNVRYHDMIRCVNEDGLIAFQDGSYIFADSIIHCTGVLSGKILLPTEVEMMDSIQDIYRQMEKNGLPQSCTLSLRPLQVDYKHWLVAQNDLPPLEEWRENLLAECIKKLIELPDKYRDQWDDAYRNTIIQT